MKKVLFIGLAVYMGIFLAGNAFGQTTFATTSGYIEDCDGTPLITLVLANGQYMYSNNPVGEFLLQVPLDENGEITLLVFATGFSPFKAVLTPQEASYVEIVLLKCIEQETCLDDLAYVEFFNNLSCGLDDITATATVCGLNFSSYSGVLSSCTSFTPGSCLVTVDAQHQNCPTLHFELTHVFAAGCLTLIALDLDDYDTPTVYLTPFCPGDCSTEVLQSSTSHKSISSTASFEIKMEGGIEADGYRSVR
jgi:hypothetical protein